MIELHSARFENFSFAEEKSFVDEIITELLNGLSDSVLLRSDRPSHFLTGINFRKFFILFEPSARILKLLVCWRLMNRCHVFSALSLRSSRSLSRER